MDINNYLIANALLTPNVRSDSGQPDAWRDYQQILSEFGLIFSMEVVDRIRPTPLGLAFLDGSVTFSELITYQALRFQYPNGHHLVISPTNRAELQGTSLHHAVSLPMLQQDAGVRLRPAVLLYRVMWQLKHANQLHDLSVDEIERYAMRCADHSDTDICVKSIVSARRGQQQLPTMGGPQRRNAQDWIKFLILSPLFTGEPGRTAKLSLSQFAIQHESYVNAICTRLEHPDSFWLPGNLGAMDRISWYGFFGTFDLSVPLAPKPDGDIADKFEAGPESEESESSLTSEKPGTIELREFAHVGEETDIVGSQKTIEVVYDAELSNRAHRLHDLMVRLIAESCQQRGATVFEDPSSVDLLIKHDQSEFLVEVKSVNPRNFIDRLRYALGQVHHYDYLRSHQSNAQRRKVVAVAAHIPDTSWCIPFLNDHLDVDLISLQDRAILIHSRSAQSLNLFR